MINMCHTSIAMHLAKTHIASECVSMLRRHTICSLIIQSECLQQVHVNDRGHTMTRIVEQDTYAIGSFYQFN
jgi:hypothetical protein